MYTGNLEIAKESYCKPSIKKKKKLDGFKLTCNLLPQAPDSLYYNGIDIFLLKHSYFCLIILAFVCENCGFSWFLLLFFIRKQSIVDV